MQGHPLLIDRIGHEPPADRRQHDGDHDCGEDHAGSDERLGHGEVVDEPGDVLRGDHGDDGDHDLPPGHQRSDRMGAAARRLGGTLRAGGVRRLGTVLRLRRVHCVGRVHRAAMVSMPRSVSIARSRSASCLCRPGSTTLETAAAVVTVSYARPYRRSTGPSSIFTDCTRPYGIVCTLRNMMPLAIVRSSSVVLDDRPHPTRGEQDALQQDDQRDQSDQGEPPPTGQRRGDDRSRRS